MHGGGGDVEGAHHQNQSQHHHHKDTAVEDVFIVSSFFSYSLVKILNARSVDST